MSDRKLKFWVNELLNHIAQDSVETEDQIELIRAAARHLTTEAAAMEVVQATKEAA